MMFKDTVIHLDTVFGDGGTQTGGFFDKLVGAGKRLITGESLFMTVFTHQGQSGKAHVGFAAPYPGTIIPLTLSELLRRNHLPERQLSVRRSRRANRNSLSKANSDGAIRRGRIHHAEVEWRWPGVSARGWHNSRSRVSGRSIFTRRHGLPGRTHVDGRLRPATSGRCEVDVLRRRRASSLLTCGGQAMSGYNPFHSQEWRGGCWLQHRAVVVSTRERARSSVRWATCWTETTSKDDKTRLDDRHVRLESRRVSVSA